MSAKHTITINGKLYDAATGLPVGESAPRRAVAAMDVVPSKPAKPRTAGHHSHTVHGSTAHSTTLRRKHLSHPESKVTSHAPKRHIAGKTGRSPMIVHFAPHPQPLPKHDYAIVDATVKTSDIRPPKRHVTHTQSNRPSSSEVKERLIAHATTTIHAVHPTVVVDKKRAPKKPLRRVHFVTAAIALVLLGGYLTYITMPGISVSVAGSQAGVAAKYPSFSPDGYSFEGPVAYQPGQVALSFKSNGGGKGYVIEQRASTWNSVALLDNYVEEASSGNYETTSQNGVTVYTYGNRAAWTNGGVFYNITGEAPLDTDQLLNIASSM